eukprot:GEMP01068466.1.p1 GENE.GEMP01068466.1~~GEMP01068466.1.p1  ORF type:complete len:240 (+),score=87.06 GEMP01068466.1:20-739(+)
MEGEVTRPRRSEGSALDQDLVMEKDLTEIEEQELAITRELQSIDQKILQKQQPDLNKLERCLSRALDALRPEDNLREIRSEIVLLGQGLARAQHQIQALHRQLAEARATAARHQASSSSPKRDSFFTAQLEMKDRRIRELEQLWEQRPLGPELQNLCTELEHYRAEKQKNHNIGGEHAERIRELESIVEQQERQIDQFVAQQVRWAEAAREDEEKMQMLHARLQSFESAHLPKVAMKEI